MKRRLITLLAGIALIQLPLTLLAADFAFPRNADPARKVLARVFSETVLEFETMVGVSGPFLGSRGNPIREVDGGGLPWVLEEAEGELKANGEFEVEVEGLIIPESAGFGFNPAPFFRAIVSCITVDESDLPTIENVKTTNGAEVMIGNPENGDAKIREKLDLPDPCIAPIVFVTSPGFAWFAVTGFEITDMDD